jgi:hypothetical protein
MNHSITVQQIRHFAQFGWIEFEPLFSSEECKELLDLLQDTVRFRLKEDPNSLSWKELYQSSRDCWRDQDRLKKIYLHRRLRSPAEQLTEKSRLLLICDQWIPSGASLDPLNLSAHLSYQNLACGCLIALEGAEVGQVRFISPERLPLFSTSQLLIAYGTIQTVYVHNPKDPSNSSLKQLGYNFGDRLAK